MMNNEAIIHEWTEKGVRAFEAQSQTTELGSDTAPLVITFKTEPPRELKSQLRDLNFKWNPFRKEWCGYGEMKALLRLIQHH
jgi:hypothetical protein